MKKEKKGEFIGASLTRETVETAYTVWKNTEKIEDDFERFNYILTMYMCLGRLDQKSDFDKGFVETVEKILETKRAKNED